MDRAFFQHSLPRLDSLDPLDWFDNSRIETFLRCHRKSWYVSFHRLEEASPAMAAGTILHAALAAYHEKQTPDRQYLELAQTYSQFQSVLRTAAAKYSLGNLTRVFDDYKQQYPNHGGLNVIQTEMPLAVWFSGKESCPEGQCACPTYAADRCFWLVGKCDGVVVSSSGEVWALENKTTSSLSANYLATLALSRQASTYTFNLRKIIENNGGNSKLVRGLLFNCIGFGQSDTKFARFPCMRSDGAMRDFEVETRRIVASMRESFYGTEKPIQNTTHCNSYGKCQFLDLCQAWAGRDVGDVPGTISSFRKAQWRPF